MAVLRDIVIDCRHPSSLARFWAAVLDGYAIAPYGEAELARRRERGIDDPEDDPAVLLEAPGPWPAPRLWFQRVPEPRAGKNRVHVDVSGDDPDSELARLLALGARRDEVQPDDRWVVLHDPEDNEFCLLRS